MRKRAGDGSTGLPTRSRRCRALHILVAAGAALSTVDTTPAAVQTFGGFVPSVATYQNDAGVEGSVGSIPITLGLRADRLSLRATIPYLDVRARTPEIPIPGPIPGLAIAHNRRRPGYWRGRY